MAGLEKAKRRVAGVVRRYALVLLVVLAVAASAAGQHKYERSIWNYDGGVALSTDGVMENGSCFRMSGKLSHAEFFTDLKRYDYDDASVYRRGKEEVKEFPKELVLQFAIADHVCSDKLTETKVRPPLTGEQVSTLRMELYWKDGMNLRPIHDIKVKRSGVHPITPYAGKHAANVTERYEWSYELTIPSEGVPVSCSLVVVLRENDDRIAARVAARL